MTPSKLAALFRNRGPLINVVLDGWGLGASDHTNAIHQASIPLMNRLIKTCPSTQLFTHGHFVGLPSENDMGGSEVGHMTMGAGKIIEQGPTHIQNLIQSGEFFKSSVLEKLIRNCLEHQVPLHLIGLLSDGNIHSHMDHFIAIIQHAFRSGVQKLYVHPLLDGRDVAIQSALKYTSQLEKLFHELHAQNAALDYAFASGGGREIITMDRDQDWRRIEAGWNVHVRGVAEHQFESIEAAIRHFRQAQPHLIDQAIPGFVLTRQGKPIAPIQDQHAVISVNFRADRAIEFTRAMVEDEFPYFDRSPRPKILFAGMTVYDQDTQMPPEHIVGATKVDRPFGKRIFEAGLTQFRLTETQKFPHVTFFFNGGYREPLDPVREKYYLIDSDKVPSFDLKPEMKAAEIAQQAVRLISSKQYDYGLINFANADMVGHSGNMQATIKAVEVVDRALTEIVDAIAQVSGLLVITADHGNADEMLSFNSKKKEWEPNTKHSINPVPFIIYDPLYQGDYQLLQPSTEKPLNLSHIAATNYVLLGQEIPDDINHSLFQFD
ncbi:2,3-bisphosphoglycerate-independent phosphoglycerate mutase [Deltaproteobacteria bacterium TL4]